MMGSDDSECIAEKGKGKIKITFCAIRLFPQNSKIQKVSGPCKFAILPPDRLN